VYPQDKKPGGLEEEKHASAASRTPVAQRGGSHFNDWAIPALNEE